MAVRKDSILPKTINMETRENPLEETCEWIIKIIGGVYKIRTKPILKDRVQDFFPHTPPSLFQTAFTKLLKEKKIKQYDRSSNRNVGFMLANLTVQ